MAHLQALAVFLPATTPPHFAVFFTGLLHHTRSLHLTLNFFWKYAIEPLHSLVSLAVKIRYEAAGNGTKDWRETVYRLGIRSSYLMSPILPFCSHSSPSRGGSWGAWLATPSL